MAMKVENAVAVRLFHGSRAGIAGEIAPISRPECDFGKGFYLGTESSQPLDANRRDGLLFREILEKKAEELGA